METEATAMPLLCLPNELLLLIASNLGIRDLTSLVITSRHLSNLITPRLNEFAIKDNKALDWAVLNNREDMVKRFLELGASVDATDNDSETALHKAVTRGNVSIVQLLLENNASLEIETISYKETPLLRAAAGLSETVVRLLVEKGADVNAENLDLRPVLSVVRAWRGHLRRAEGWDDRVEKLLLKHGANRSRAMARYYL